MGLSLKAPLRLQLVPTCTSPSQDIARNTYGYFLLLPSESRASVDFFLFHVEVCYCVLEQDLLLEVGFIANKTANTIIMIAYIACSVPEKAVEKDWLVLSDFLSTIIFLSILQPREVNLLLKLAVEFLLSL